MLTCTLPCVCTQLAKEARLLAHRNRHPADSGGSDPPPRGRHSSSAKRTRKSLNLKGKCVVAKGASHEELEDLGDTEEEEEELDSCKYSILLTSPRCVTSLPSSTTKQ